MLIDDKYFDLLHTLIYDKRCKMSGILSSFEVSKYITGYGISFRAYMNSQNPNHYIFVEDFEKGNVVFLIPFDVKYMDGKLEHIEESNIEKIKNFFGDKYNDNMIMRISEQDRQEEIRKWDEISIGLNNWNRYFNSIDK